MNQVVEDKYAKQEKRARKFKKAKKIAMVILLILLPLLLYINITAQVTTGGFAGMQVGGFDKYSQAYTDFYCMTTLYANKNKKGMNASLFTDFQVPPASGPAWAYFAAVGGWRFPFKPPMGDTLSAGFFEFGGGIGFQTGQQQTMLREMGYVMGIFPIKIKRRHFKQGYGNHPIIIFGSFDISTIQSYRYKAFALFQITDTPDHIDLLLGAHAERYVGIGPTLQIHIGKTRKVQVAFTCAYSLEQKNVSGAVGFLGRW